MPVNPAFPLGQVVATPAALKLVPLEVLLKWLHRHQTGDWGDVGPEDWAAVTGHFKRDHPGSKFGDQNHPPLSARGLVAIMG